MTAYYNEIDATAAHVLRHLIAEGVIAPGDVDTRSIKDVHADDLRGYTQCHFFAGGGLWSVAARLAGWPDDRPLWTGSCPCQPFSQAGQGRGFADERHLWPDFHRLIRAVRPNVVVGEQVAGSLGYGWLDGVAADLAAEDYASRAVDIPACAVDAPNIRQRLYWVAMAAAEHPERRAETDTGRSHHATEAQRWHEGATQSGERHGSSGVTLGDAIQPGLERQPRHGDGAAGRQEQAGPVAEADGGDGQMGHAAAPGSFSTAHPGIHRGEESPWPRDAQPQRRNGSFWSDHEWIECHDGKARRTKPGLRLLVDGLPGRVGLWRIAGNAINPVLAAEVLGALMDGERMAA